jgi:hypothetical protein
LLNCVKIQIPSILFLGKSRSFAKRSYMKKIYLIVTLFAAVLLLQNCKKDTVIASAASNALMFAIINDTTWSADTVTASITYNSILKTKVFNCTAIAKNKELNMSATQSNASNTPGFPLSTFNADSAGTNKFSYYINQKNSSGNYEFVQSGTVAPGSGTVIITAIDSVKKVMTGIFSFASKKNNYDSNGNITSVTISEITAGAFNNMPYTFKSN